MAALGMVALALAVAVALWGAWHPDDLGAAFVLPLAAALILGVAAVAAARGCFVELGEHELRDVVGWRTIRRIPRPSVVEARVLAGAWRWFEIELADGRLVRLLGAGPAQLPARLMPASKEEDLAALAELRGSPREDRPAP